MREKTLFGGAAVARGTCTVNHREKLQLLPVGFGRSIESVAKIVGQPLCLVVPYSFRNQ